MTANPLPPAVGAYLLQFVLADAHPAVLTFDSQWRLRATHGEVAFYGTGSEHVEALRALFVGCSIDENQHVALVELASGCVANVHLITAGDGFNVLLLDAGAQRAEQRVHQQARNEAVLLGHAKSRAIEQLKDIRHQLERQRSDLEEANSLKNAMIATLSHEFRTPLTSICGYVHLLERRREDFAHARQALGAIRRNATYLYALAENLLEYGRGEAGALLNGTEVDLQAMASDLEDMFRPLAEYKGLGFAMQVEIGDPARPVFDEVRLRQIAINLLSNAVRYTAHGEIAAGFLWRAGSLRLDVRDTGIGIAPERRDDIFKPFNRGGQSGSKGAGLGLSIVRRLVELMNGQLVFDSHPGEGSRFVVVLPPLEGEVAIGISASPWMQSADVLVVDDDPDIAQLLQALLTDLGFNVRSVGDAQSAIEEVARLAPDVLLIDIELPDIPGVTAVKQLRANGYRGRVVVLSAISAPKARDAALGAGADFYLSKPLNVEQFVGVMQRAMQAQAAT